VTDLERLAHIASALSIGRVQRHIFLCAGQSTPRCSTYERSIEVWGHLKRRLKELDLASAPANWRGDGGATAPPTPAGEGLVLRTKVDCLRICEQGPIAVVYPEGAWYRMVDEDAVDRIIREHLIDGRVVEDLLFALAPLTLP
jgi:(2Fe-2S) ferredoxin